MEPFVDWYALLGVADDASIEEIKKAFRVGAKRWHPDVNSSPGANAHFHQLKQACEILSDPTKRAAYDAQFQLRRQTSSDPNHASKSSSQRESQQRTDPVSVAYSLIKMGRYQEALDACDRALRLDPHNALAHINASLALIEMGRYQEALDACDRALRLDPHNVLAHLNASAALIGIGHYLKALDACDRALRLDPHNVPAHLNAGEAFIKMWRYREALRAYNQALRLDPQNISAQIKKANLLRENW